MVDVTAGDRSSKRVSPAQTSEFLFLHEIKKKSPDRPNLMGKIIKTD